MAYADIYAAATASDHVLRKQVAVAIVKAAVDVMNESTATEDHSQRMTWARRALSDPLGWAEKAIWKVLENATIQSAPTEATDNDVQFVVNALVNTLSKAS
jgi:hypothetical protein